MSAKHTPTPGEPFTHGYVPIKASDVKWLVAERNRLREINGELVEAAEALERAETAHANCTECEGAGVPECCAVCFPLFDDARLKRRAALAKATQARHGGE